MLALTSLGDHRDAERTAMALKLTFPVLPGPHQKLAEEYGVWNAKRGWAIATLIIDKSGTVRFLHQPSSGVEDRPKVDQLLKALQDLKE